MPVIPATRWAVLVLVLAACTPTPAPEDATPSPTLDPTPESYATRSPSSAETVVVLAAGDIAGCDSDGDEATAALLDGLDGTILTLGDNAYPDGTTADFAGCYDASWGRHRDRTYPTAGNHDYATPGAAAYFSYFGERAGVPGEGWYSFDLGAWHVIALNSNCDEVGGCGGDSLQAEWLRADLEENPGACTLAYWHHPRWSSGAEHGSDSRTDTFWRILHDAGADLVLSGHDHQYERFRPMDADGAPSRDGVTSFVVGTGGRPLYRHDQALPASAARDSSNLGVLRLTLGPDRAAWEFLSAPSDTFRDAGSATCH